MSEKMTLRKLQAWIDAPPFHGFLGIEAVSLDAEAGEVVLKLAFRKAFRRSEDAPVWHGGVTAALIDIAGDYALAVKLGYGVPTIDLRIDYLRMAVDSDLWATARVIKAGRSLGVVDVEVKNEAGDLVAVGRGTYATKKG